MDKGVFGVVIDAATKQVIHHAQVHSGQFGVMCGDGAFLALLNDVSESGELKVQAEGYESASEKLKGVISIQGMNFALKKAKSK